MNIHCRAAMLAVSNRVISVCEQLTRRPLLLNNCIKDFSRAALSSSGAQSNSLENASTTSSESKNTKLVEAKKESQMSSAMRMYLKRKREHDSFISKERAEFDIGRQHLANMMGLDHENMTQDQIDKSIEYLFPSGLAPEARPIMKPPEEVFPKQKDVEFDNEGRPFHPFFYTLKPNFTKAIFTTRDHIESVTIFGDRLRRQGRHPDSTQVLNLAKLADTRWMTLEEVSRVSLETVSQGEYDEFILTLERLVSLPYSYKVIDDIFKWRVKEVAGVAVKDFIEPQFDERGRAWVETEGRRRTSHAVVRVSKPGTGKVEISHKSRPDMIFDISYFYALKDRHQLMFPLQFSKLLGLVDIKAEVEGGGPSGQSGAIRYATAMAIRSFVDKETVDEMKLVGLLTQDIRVRERKKPGQVKARKSYTWKRR